MSTISLVMIVKNESQNLEKCLKSVCNYVDEIIIVDTGSTDNTKQIASMFDVKLFDFKWINDFSAARNFGIREASSDWILVLDADEHVMNGKVSIKEFIKGQKDRVGRIQILSLFKDNNEDRIVKSFVSRIFPKGVYYKGRIHEQLDTFLPRVNTEISVNHYGYYVNNKVSRNLKILLEELKEEPQNSYILFQVAKQYKLSKEFKDARKYLSKAYKCTPENEYFRPTLIVDYLYNIISTKDFEKGLELIELERTRYVNYTDFQFVCGLFYMELVFSNPEKYQCYFSMIELSFVRCLEIGEMNEYESVQGTGSFLAFYNLGVYNEAIGNNEAAIFLYSEAEKLGYKKAKERIEKLQQ